MSPAWSRGVHTVRGAVALAAALLLGRPAPVAAQTPGAAVRVVTDAQGSRLQVDGRDFFVRGVNWDYFPIGHQLRLQPLDAGPTTSSSDGARPRDGPAASTMGANAIRVYAGIPPRWVRYIYERFGIWTIVNHAARTLRQLTVERRVGSQNTDYSDTRASARCHHRRESMRHGRSSSRARPACSCGCSATRTTTASTWKLRRHREPPGGRARMRPRRKLSSTRSSAKWHREHQARRTPRAPGGDGQRRPAVSRPDRAGERKRPRHLRHQRLSRHGRSGDLFQQREGDHPQRPGDVHRVRRRCMERARVARGPAVNQARVRARAVARDLRAERRQGPRVGNAIGGFTFQWSDGWWKYGQETAPRRA